MATNENELKRSLPISILEKMNNDYFMSVPGDPRLGFIVNLPSALTGDGVNTLPPYAPVRASKVDLFPGAPAEWPRSSGNTASYFIPIVEGRGMWLDFNRCFDHPHHVAVAVSIQGVNPLTGRKADKLELERYGTDDKVEEWLRGRQNYLATTSTPRGTLWIDGFRAADGTVRQYIFTKDEKKGVASQIIGVDRVFAIGVAFFLSKEPKPVEQPRGGRRNYGGGSSDDFLMGYKGDDFLGFAGAADYDCSSIPTASAYYVASSTGDAPIGASGLLGSSGHKGSTKNSYAAAGSGLLRSMNVASASCPNANSRTYPGVSSWDATDKLEIAAGAKISQELYKDTVAADYWQDVCAGIIAVSYAPAALIEEIFAAGQVAEKEGYLTKLAVGN